MRIDQSECMKCGICEEVCPIGAISVDGQGAKIDKDKCIECEQCLDVQCPADAIVRGDL